MADDQEVEEIEPEYGNEEGEEEDSPRVRKGRRDETKQREKYIRLLKNYIDNMAYTNIPQFPPKDTDRTERLAKPKKHKMRTKETDEMPPVIAVEDLQKKIEAHEKREETKLKAKRKRKRLYNTIIEKLRKQWHEHFMKLIIKKFGDYMAERSMNYKCTQMSTEGRQRLIRGLVCNMYVAMNINKPPCSMEQSLYETLGYILADMILETLFAAQNKEEEVPIKEEEIRKKCEPIQIPKPIIFKKKHRWTLKTKKGAKRTKPVMLPKLPNDFKYMLELFIKRKLNQCKNKPRQKGDSTQISPVQSSKT